MNVFKSSLLISAESYLNTLLISASFFILAKYITPSELGKFSTIESIAIIFSFFNLSSLDFVFQKDALKSNDGYKIFRDALYFKMICSAIGYLLAVMISIFIFKFDVNATLIISFLIIFKIYNLMVIYFVSNSEVVRYVKFGISISIISFVIKILIVNYGNREVIPYFYIVDCFLMFFSLYSIFVRKDYDIKVDLLRIFSIVKDNYLFILSSFTIIAFGKVDQVIISKFLNFENVANFALSMKIIGAYVIVSNAFNMPFVKKLSLSHSDKNEYKKNIKVLMKYTLLIGLGLSFVNFILSPVIISFIYGDKYEQSEYIVRALSPLIFLIFLSSSIGKILVVEGFGDVAFIRNIAGLTLSVLINVLLIPFIGMNASIIASLLSWFFSSILIVFLFKKTRFIFY